MSKIIKSSVSLWILFSFNAWAELPANHLPPSAFPTLDPNKAPHNEAPADPSVTDDIIKRADDYIISKVGKEYFAAHYTYRQGPGSTCEPTVTSCRITYDYDNPTHAHAINNLVVIVEVRKNPAKAPYAPPESGFVATIRDGKVISPDPKITYEVAIKTAYDFLAAQSDKKYTLPPFSDVLVEPYDYKPSEEFLTQMKDITLNSSQRMSLMEQENIRKESEYKKHMERFHNSPINGTYYQTETWHATPDAPEFAGVKKKIMEDMVAAAKQNDEAKVNELKKQLATLGIPEGQPAFTMDKDWLWGTIWRLKAKQEGCYIDYTVGVSAITGQVIEHKEQNSDCTKRL